METRLRKRLAWAKKDPRRAVAKGWVQDRDFLLAFFDLCDQLAFVCSPEALDLALRAVEFAEAHGDRHLIHRSSGVLCHAFIARHDLFWAGKILRDARRAMLDCCPPCRSELFRAQGFLLGEERKAEESLRSLDHALEEGAGYFDADARARITYFRSYAYYFLGRRDQAVRDVRRALRDLSLDSPRGFFLDCGAILPIFVTGGDPRHDREALATLGAFSERVKGIKGWKAMHVRSAWAAAHHNARLGDIRRAHRQIEIACGQLRGFGLAREAVAATLDRCQLLCRGDEPRGNAPRVAHRLIGACLRERSDLTAAHREGLEEMQRVLDRRPEDAFAELVAFRRSFIAPVPGAMAERIGAP